MLQNLSRFINIKGLLNEIEYEQNNNATSIALMSYSGIDNTQLMPELCLFLKRTLNLSECGFFWSDVQGNLVDAWCTAPQFLCFKTLMTCAEYQASGDRVWPTFTENVLLGPTCGYLLPFQNEKFYASPHYQSVYKPMGVRYLLDVVLHDGTRPYGAFLMMRSAKDGAFTPDERNYFSKLIPTLTSAFQPSDQPESQSSDLMHVGFAVMTRDEEVRFMDAKASSIVWALTYDEPGAFARPDAPSLEEGLRKIVKPHWSRLLQGEQFTFDIKNRWGLFQMSFIKQHDSDGIVINFSKSVPLHAHLINKLHALNLPPTRLMVAWMLVLNYSRQQISKALGVSEETVTSHIKTLYRETNTQSGHSLLLKLIA